MAKQEPRPDAPFYIVLNAGSGRTDTELRCATIRKVLEAAGRTCVLEVVHDGAKLPEVAANVAKSATAEGAILVAAGGDGTLNAVAHEAVKHGCVFGVLPQGTFNYFGRTHGIPEDLHDAVHALLRARVRHVQIGMVNNRSFLVNASVGLYPRLLEEREHDKRQFGRSRVVALLSGRRRIKVAVDGEVCKLELPLCFEALDGRLALLVADPLEQTARADAAEDGSRVD